MNEEEQNAACQPTPSLPHEARNMPLHPMSDRLTQNYLQIVTDWPGEHNHSGEYRVWTINAQLAEIKFQKGPVGEVGVNGIGVGTLLQICHDYLSQLNASEYKCRENALAITSIEEALGWLKQRELARAQRGVLGTSQV